MSHTLPTLMFVDAMVGATAYAPQFHEASDPSLPTAVMEHVRQARVDVYCSHNRQAMRAIHDARRALHASPIGGVADALIALDEAAWFIRHNDFLHAEEALETALDRVRVLLDRHSRAS